MNSVNIIGTMVKDLDLKYLPSGVAAGSVSIAVNQDYKDAQGKKVEKTSFFDVKIIGKQAEIINQYFHKGSRIGVSGSLEQETWKAQDGTNRSRVVIKLESFSFIDKKSNDNQNSQRNMQEPPKGGGEYINNKGLRDIAIPEIDLDQEIPF